MGAMLLYAMKNIKSRSERPRGARRSFSPPPGQNWDPTPSEAYSLTCPVSNRMQFGNRTLRPSGEAALAGSGLVMSLVSSPRNRPLEKLDEDVRGYLGGLVVDGM